MLYTDGVTDAVDPAGTFFRLERRQSLAELRARIEQTVDTNEQRRCTPGSAPCMG